MISDIKIPEVKNVTLAIARKKALVGADEWFVYIINNNPHPIDNTLVASHGYGEKEGEKQRTSTLRHFLDIVPPNSAIMVEPIDASVFHLNNEYWVSYYIDKQIFDKKFVFVPDTICQATAGSRGDLVRTRRGCGRRSGGRRRCRCGRRCRRIGGIRTNDRGNLLSIAGQLSAIGGQLVALIGGVENLPLLGAPLPGLHLPVRDPPRRGRLADVGHQAQLAPPARIHDRAPDRGRVTALDSCHGDR